MSLPRTPSMPTTAATPTLLAGSPWLLSTHCPSGGTTGPSTSYVRTPYSKGGVMSGEPLLQRLFHPDLSQALLDPLQTLLDPPRMLFRLVLRILLHPSIRLSNHPGHLSALAGTCCVIRPVITVDTSYMDWLDSDTETVKFGTSSAGTTQALHLQRSSKDTPGQIEPNYYFHLQLCRVWAVILLLCHLMSHYCIISTKCSCNT
jgi:hypothetical protein